MATNYMVCRVCTCVCAPQVEDSSKLEYQAGQEEEQGDGKDKRKPEAQQQQQQEAGGDADKDGQGGEGEEEEGGVNEDVEDKFEESHYAPPTAPEQVRVLTTLNHTQKLDPPIPLPNCTVHYSPKELEVSWVRVHVGKLCKPALGCVLGQHITLTSSNGSCFSAEYHTVGLLSSVLCLCSTQIVTG